jgi:predicted DNA-binding WGR domain protein
MDGLLQLRMEAHNPDRNHHRWYEVRLGRDLFGLWVVTIGYGRAGFAGQTLLYSDTDAGVARDMIRHFLQRRASAPRRIGCEYTLTAVEAADGIRPVDWLPPDVLAGVGSAPITAHDRR